MQKLEAKTFFFLFFCRVNSGRIVSHGTTFPSIQQSQFRFIHPMLLYRAKIFIFKSAVCVGIEPYKHRINLQAKHHGALLYLRRPRLPAHVKADQTPSPTTLSVVSCLLFPSTPEPTVIALGNRSGHCCFQTFLFGRSVIVWHRSRICLLSVSSYIHRNTISLQCVSLHLYSALEISNIPFLLGAFCKPTHFKWNHSREQDSISHPTISP